MADVEKGITPVVATVLLLFISIGLVGTASVFVEGTIADFQTGLEEKMQEEEEDEATSITLISKDLSASSPWCLIRNTGGVTIEKDLWFIDGTEVEGPETLDPNDEYNLSGCSKGLLEHPQGASAVIG